MSDQPIWLPDPRSAVCAGVGCERAARCGRHREYRANGKRGRWEYNPTDPKDCDRFVTYMGLTPRRSPAPGRTQ